MHSVEMIDAHEGVPEDYLFTLQDKGILRSLGIDLELGDVEAYLEDLNNLLALAGEPLDPPVAPGQSTPRNERIMAAKATFISELSAVNDFSKERLLRRDNLQITPRTVVGTLRLLRGRGNDISKVINSDARVLALDPDQAEQSLGTLDSLNLYSKRVVEECASVLYMPEAELLKAIKDMTDLGLDYVRVINAFPGSLKLGKRELEQRINNLTSRGFDTKKLLKDYPGLLHYKTAALNAKLDGLDGLGLNSVALVSRYAKILHFEDSEIEAWMENLESFGIDPVLVLNLTTEAVSRSNEQINETINTIGSTGVDAAKAIELCPDLLLISSTTLKARIDNLIRLGLNVKEVIRFKPEILLSTEARINVRYRVLASAARAWGVDAYRDKTNETINEFPDLLTYNADRNRVFIRIINSAVRSGSELPSRQIRGFARLNLESALASYLEREKLPVEQMEQLIDRGRRYWKLGQSALEAIIYDPKYAANPAVKNYVRMLKVKASRSGVRSSGTQSGNEKS